MLSREWPSAFAKSKFVIKTHQIILVSKPSETNYNPQHRQVKKWPGVVRQGLLFLSELLQSRGPQQRVPRLVQDVVHLAFEVIHHEHSGPRVIPQELLSGLRRDYGETE